MNCSLMAYYNHSCVILNLVPRNFLLFRINFQLFFSNAMCGQGEYGKNVKSKFYSEFVALKVLGYVDKEDIKKEAKFLAKLNHPSIV